MIVGHNHYRLEKRITAALLSGKTHPREAIFLHKISMRLGEYGKNARLSDAQMGYLSSILDRLEPTSSARPEKPSPCTRPSHPQLQPKQPQPFRIDHCFNDPQSSPPPSSTSTQSNHATLSMPMSASTHGAPWMAGSTPSPGQHSKAFAELESANPNSSKPIIQSTDIPSWSAPEPVRKKALPFDPRALHVPKCSVTLKAPSSPPDEPAIRAWSIEYFSRLDARRQHAQNVKHAQERRWQGRP